jgi:Glycosyl transferase family 2
MTLLVRDEQELLATNIEFHLRQGVDFVLVSDHGSTDATAEILAGYVAQGVARVMQVEGEALDQGGWVTRMARVAAVEHEADWVINNDADEFWWPVAGTLKDMLGLIPARYGQLKVPRHNFIPRPGDEPFWKRMVVREARSQNLVGRELEPNVVHRGHPEVVVDHGNHWVLEPELEPAPPVPLIEVLHFPIRTYAQFEHKVKRAGPGYQKLAGRRWDVGRDQLTLYDIFLRGGLPDYFREAMLDDEPIEERLASGDLVVDRRLERFLSGAADEVRLPELLAVRRLADEAFSLSESLGQTRAELATAQASLAEREAAHAHAQRRLDQISRELQQLRDSRLVRWTAPLRSLYYRTRLARRAHRPVNPT